MKSHSGSWLSTVTFLSVSSQILPPATNVQYYMNGPRANKRDEFRLPLTFEPTAEQPTTIACGALATTFVPIFSEGRQLRREGGGREKDSSDCIA